MHWVLGPLFWLSALAVVWTYAGYPLFISLLARWRPRPHRRGDSLPSVSLVIPAYNEEGIIAEKLENVLGLDYPAEKREIVVVADGSTDRTVEIVRQYASYGVRLLFQPQRGGKIAAMNRAAGETHGEVLVFSDANAMFEPQSLRALVRNLADPRVACVSGAKRVRADRQAQARGESAYWRYEAQVKVAETLVGTTIGAVGEFFAVRRELYQTMEEDCLIEDFVLSMRLAMEGWRVVYEPQAVTWEEASPSLRAEWERRARMAAGGFQAIGRLRGLLSPRYGFLALQFFSHKVLRWTAVLAMLLAAACSAALYAFPLYRLFFWAQVGFYLLGLLGWVTTLLRYPWRPAQLVFYFCFANATALGGLVRYLIGVQSVTWKKVR